MVIRQVNGGQKSVAHPTGLASMVEHCIADFGASMIPVVPDGKNFSNNEI